MAKPFSTKKLSIGLLVIMLSLLLMTTNEAFSQTAVTPPGAGTESSPYLISQLGHLVWMSDNAADSAGKYYTMTADIDASATATWNDAGTSSSVLECFKPINVFSFPVPTGFRGIFNGAGHTITRLFINRKDENYVGLFGCIGLGGEVRNLGLIGGIVNGNEHVGGLVGNNSGGTISNVYTTGSVTGDRYVGGLVGYNNGTVSNSYATGSVMADSSFFVPENSSFGGLVGGNSGTVSNSYATGMVLASSFNLWGASGGGLVGEYCRTAIIGGNYGEVSNSYWDIQTSGQSVSAGGTGKTTAEMKQQTTFINWDFSTIWIINENVTYPRLRPLLLPSDANLDGMVDVGDLGIFAANYGQSGKTWLQGDFNGDGVVDVGDLGILAAHYGQGVSGAVDFDSDSAKVFGVAANNEVAESESAISLCSGLGLPIVAMLIVMGFMIVRLKD